MFFTNMLKFTNDYIKYSFLYNHTQCINDININARLTISEDGYAFIYLYIYTVPITIRLINSLCLINNNNTMNIH